MRSFFTLIALIASASAYQVLTPGNTVNWTTSGPNAVTWQRVSTDPANFTMLLVNQDKTILPAGQEILIAQVDGSTLKVANVPPPSGGFKVGDGYQVNFVASPETLNTILAQTGQFSIIQSNTTPSSSSSNSVNSHPNELSRTNHGHLWRFEPDQLGHGFKFHVI
ncbi:hypothetical protein BC827DRAFT_577816 [Russula dissimulans]|nr:hypothetical protein BC827DRAFT_577816 [Russula dissimulans]